jgi:pimeloyl-ACP methyl ester carboxylesterase
LNRPVPLPVLLVPVATELEWRIAPLLRERTEVATFDAPGVGSEPPPERFDRAAIAQRALAEIESRGWDRCVVAGDEFGSVTAALVASLASERVAALALGHAALTLATDGAAPPLNAEVLNAFLAMERQNYRAYAQALSQVTQGSYDDDFVTAFLARVPQEVTLAYAGINRDDPDQHLDALLAGFEGELLLAEHNPCLLYTREGFRAAAAAFPRARTIVCERKPSVSPRFATAIGDLAARLAEAPAG